MLQYQVFLISSSPSAVVLPQFATKNHAVALSLLPPSQWDGEENQKEKDKNLWVEMRTV